MDEKSTTKLPLLVSKDDDLIVLKKLSFLRSLAMWFLKFAIWVIFITWAAFIFLYPLDSMNELYYKWIQATEGTLFGVTGSVFLIFSGPILIITFLATAHLIISGKEEIHKRKKTNGPTFSLWTFPALIDGPFGVVSVAELIGILLFLVYTIWAISVFTVRNYHILPLFHMPSKYQSALMLELTGLRFGYIGLICLAFLFLPVARGSVLLRYVHIPFEQATRYHVWLGHLTMLLFTFHGGFYVIGWWMQGILWKEIKAWQNIGIANLPGVISLLAGLVMWITSMPGVRRINFELFFYTHQLYVIFIVFLALHVGDFIFSIAAAGIFLFMLDRFLRFCQSRRVVDVLHTRCFPNGIVELVLSKPAGLHYNALGWIFLQVRELSFLQWHPFSVSSSPLDGKYHLSVLIKDLGKWTEKLKDQVSSISEEQSKTQLLLQSHPKISAFVEGPYGHESPYHLMYENLILVAGGIGISPFLAILRDILHHINDGKPCMTKNVLVVWSVKKSDELPLLHTLDMESICPSFSDSLNLEIQTYITRESESSSMEEGKVHLQDYFSVVPQSKKGSNSMSVLVGTCNIIWSGIYVTVSTIGFIVSIGLLNTFYINPFNIHSWWYKGLLFLACMTASVIVFGGLVIGLWHLWERNNSLEEELKDDETIDIVQESDIGIHKNSGKQQYVSTTRYAQRPDFGDIFGAVSKQWGSVDIGVIVCGPYALMSSVARECRTRNLKRKQNQPIFHFNSHSFDL